MLKISELEPEFFFDLTNYAFADIFDGCHYVWEALAKITPYILSRELGIIESLIPQGTYLINPEKINIGKRTKIEPGAYIEGPCIIGDDCQVRHGAYIRGSCLAGNSCVIGHDTEVKNAIFLDNAHAAHFAYVGDSILGNKVNLGAGTKCANLRFDGKPVTLKIDGKRIDTNLRKFGAIVGDGAQTGCNSVLNPGTLLGKGVTCAPCINVGGFVKTQH